MREIYLEAKQKIEEDLAALRKKNPQVTIRTVSQKTFTTVIQFYFTYMFLDMIQNSSIVKLYQRFGFLHIVKTKPTRYKPTYTRWRTVDGKKVAEKVKMDLFKTNGYIPFAFWDAPAKWRHYRFRMAKKWKRMVYQALTNGTQYLDYTMNEYGRNASNTYIYP